MEVFAPPFGHFFTGNTLMPDHAPILLRQDAEEAIDIAARWADKLGSDAEIPRLRLRDFSPVRADVFDGNFAGLRTNRPVPLV